MPGGVVIIVEKIIQSDQTVQSFYKGTYRSYKKQGYSHEEIANKDLALDTVLQPLTYDQNRQLLLSAGLSLFTYFFGGIILLDLLQLRIMKKHKLQKYFSLLFKLATVW